MQEIWRENGPPAYMSLAAYVGWKAPSSSDKRVPGEPSKVPEGYGDLGELEAMFADTGGVIQ